MIESHLLFKSEPDIVIRAGGKRLTDFLIWQSVYSELYFTDVNWLDFRKVDFLRVIRDFQKRTEKIREMSSEAHNRSRVADSTTHKRR